MAGAVTSASTSAQSTPPAMLQQSFEKVRSGVVRFEVADCGSTWQGSGFQLSPDLVVTVAHVVDQGQVVRVIEGTTSTAGTVIGLDQGTDVALVRTAVPLHGQALTFADSAPRVGDQVAALGFPRGEPLGFNPGTVNGLGRKADIDGYLRHDLLEMDAATNPGSSGGPVIRADGAVVGLVDAGPQGGDQGERLAVSSATARPLVQGWSAAPQPAPPGDCTGAVYPDGTPVPPEVFPTREGMQVVTTLSVYFDAINGGDFPTALAQLVHPGSLEAFSTDVASSFDDHIRYQELQTEGPTRVVWVTFTSHQDPGKGPAERPQETCTEWSLDYVMAPANGLWLIDATRPHDGAAPAPCAGSASGTGATDGSGSTSPPS
ncbi:MAG TPA: serine protease [Blastococcus sp.]|nr:serine protease [Blastococcus sp.]